MATLLGNDPRLVDKLIHAANQSGEKLWQLPIFEEHEEQLKSSIADMKNIGGEIRRCYNRSGFSFKFR